MVKEQIRKLCFMSLNSAENIEQAWSAGTACTKTVQRWFNRFSSRDLSLKEEDGRGRPSQVGDDELKALVRQTLGQRCVN